MRRKRGLSLKWNKKLVYLLCLIMVAAFATGCMEEDYYDQMDDSGYEIWEEDYISYDDANGAADYEEAYNDADNDDELLKGNSGDKSEDIDYTFRNDDLLESHYEKHGEDMGFDSPEEYEAAANKVVDDEDVLHKTEAEDGDDIYYLEETNEFVVISTDGYIRTYFYPDDGIDYFNRQ